MGFFITPTGDYYEGDRIDSQDAEVARKPSADHEWSGGEWVVPKDRKVEQVKVAVQGILDAAAQSLGYDDIKSAVTYADEPAVPLFQEQGRALRAWRSLVWAKCYEILAEVEAGTRLEPTVEELVTELPILNI